MQTISLVRRRAVRVFAIVASVAVSLASVEGYASQQSWLAATQVSFSVDFARTSGNEFRDVAVKSRPKLAATLADAIDAIGEADSHGLDGARYNLTELRVLEGAALSRRVDGEFVEYIESVLRYELLAYAADLLFGTQLPDEQRIHELRTAIDAAVREDRISAWLTSILPAHAAYYQLRSALRELEELHRTGDWISVGAGPTLQPGADGERVRRLRERLGMASAGGADSVYDEDLGAAVTQYQKRHGLDADGLAGRRTIRHLDKGLDARIAQVRENLARWRQTPLPNNGSYIHVNVPEYRLEFVRPDREPISMRVIVGRKENPTPAFSDFIEYLVFSPYWDVPRRIAASELLPEIALDPGYLERSNFEVIGAEGVVTPGSIDWDTIDVGEFPYRLRQKPGSHNSLGQVKFIFPNNYNVYMHDTPAVSLFESSRRAFSHGCVRVERPSELAAALLGDSADWSPHRVQALMEGLRPSYVALREPVAVVITYFTVTVGDDGSVRFFDDIYNRDRLWQERLASTFLPGPPPVQVVRLAAETGNH